jgi:hypothetical protein
VKRCARCGDEKPLEEFRWLKATGRADRRDSYCHDCRLVKQRESYQRHREKRAAANRRRNAEKGSVYRAAARARRQAVTAEEHEAMRRSDNERYWIRNLRKHGLTPEAYESLLRGQNGVCGICRTDKPGRTGRGTMSDRFHIDHDHATGNVRGLLCGSCNRGIGLLGDTLEGVEAAARYLRLTTGC